MRNAGAGAPLSRRFSSRHFLAVLVVMFLASPFLDDVYRRYPAVSAAIITVVLLSAALAVGDRRRIKIWAGLLGGPAILVTWLHRWFPDNVPEEYGFALAVLFAAFVAIRLFRFVLAARKVDGEVLSAAVATYLMLALLWSFAYMLIGKANPGAFAFTVGPASGRSMEGFTSLYFSLTTLSTVGYGDIVPVSNVARLLSTIEAVAGMFFVTLLIARLVSVYASGDRPENP
jgi:hypothetical protein